MKPLPVRLVSIPEVKGYEGLSCSCSPQARQWFLKASECSTQKLLLVLVGTGRKLILAVPKPVVRLFRGALHRQVYGSMLVDKANDLGKAVLKFHGRKHFTAPRLVSSHSSMEICLLCCVLPKQEAKTRIWGIDSEDCGAICRRGEEVSGSDCSYRDHAGGVFLSLVTVQVPCSNLDFAI